MFDDSIDQDMQSPLNSNGAHFLKKKEPNQSQMCYLNTINVNYPVRNKAKTLNTHIINFEFEGSLKQEMFLMEFDLSQALPELE